MFELTSLPSQFADLLIFFTIFVLFFLTAYFKSFLWLVRAAFAFIFAHPVASLLYDLNVLSTVKVKNIFLLWFTIIFALFLFGLRKMHFNFSYNSIWSKLTFSFALSLFFIYFMVSTFNPSFIVYDAFSEFKDLILSANYTLLMYAALLTALLLL